MQKTRSWQESFDRLAAARRDVPPRFDSEAQLIRDAEAAYARAASLKAELAPGAPLILAQGAAEAAEPLVSPAPRAKARKAKPIKAKASPRKRPAARRSAAKTKPKAAKSKAAKPKVAKPRVAKLRPAAQAAATSPAKASPPPAMALPQQGPAATPEQLLITPLPRHVSPAPWRKTGLFGLIGSWLRIAARQTTAGFAAGVRRQRKSEGKPRPLDEVVELKAENERLRQQLEALLVMQQQGSKAH